VCLALGVARATVYRRRRPPTQKECMPRPTPARALAPSERQAVLDVLATLQNSVRIRLFSFRADS
jgi:hypothetical protein